MITSTLGVLLLIVCSAFAHYGGVIIFDFLFAPVAASNEPLTKLEYTRKRKRSVACSLFRVVFAVILCLMKITDVYTTLLILGVVAASGSIVVAKI